MWGPKADMQQKRRDQLVLISRRISPREREDQEFGKLGLVEGSTIELVGVV